jgi:hypothetical protein
MRGRFIELEKILMKTLSGYYFLPKKSKTEESENQDIMREKAKLNNR